MTELVAAGALAPTTGTDAANSTKVLSVRQLAWRKFRKNKLAVFGLVVLVVMYLGAAFAGFLAPYGDRETHAQFARVGPHGLNLIDTEGQFHLTPFVYGLERTMDRKTFKQVLTTDSKGAAFCLEACEAVLHLLQLFGRMRLPVRDFADDAKRLARAV